VRIFYCYICMAEHVCADVLLYVGRCSVDNFSNGNKEIKDDEGI
jgi:hypothetical protein